MAIEGLTSHYNDYEVNLHGITERQCEMIIEAALDVVETTGIKVEHKRTIDLMTKAGCTYDGENMKIPRQLVFDAVKTIPRSIDIYDRLGNLAITLDGSKAYFGNGPTNPFVNDFETGERRPTVVADVGLSATVSDACENIDFLMNLADPADVPKAINDVYSMREMIVNSSKPVMCLAVDEPSLREQFEMALAVYGGDWDAFRAKPFATAMPISPISPLCMPEDAAMEKMYFCCENGIPMCFANAVQPGMTGPVTLAGSAVVMMAEQFFGMVLSQLIRKGTPYIGTLILYTVDMQTMIPCYGTPEHCNGDRIGPDLYRYLGVPLLSTAGASDSKIVDEQYAIETAFTAYTNILSRGGLVHDVGFMDSALTTHLDSITMADEIIGYARHIAKGIEVDEESLAVDLIKKWGKAGFTWSRNTRSISTATSPGSQRPWSAGCMQRGRTRDAWT